LTKTKIQLLKKIGGTFMKDNYLTETKVSKSQNGKSKTFTYSTVIPKVIVTKFGLDKGNKLCWDIDGNKILITPELPETPSIEAGYDILNDMLIKGKTKAYTLPYNSISNALKSNKPDDEKVKDIVTTYNNNKNKGYNNPDEFKKVVLYLLDYPLTPEQHEILKKAYDEITKN
jgi:bifunctional DNA-binding transcriptional regulator/antitoxin component of YhaV-PrlF toxin-antitoxin module